ncbi:MAG: hypothetical protein HY308_14685 [Gammaproteobacteria bacterium]|nr:hypothetical protein [Gammaproteobacteria bacterium]
MPLYLCLDQGGHASRALVFDERGDVIARAVREVATTYPAVDQVEQDPEAVVDSLRAVATAALADLGARANDVIAVGLATQRSSLVAWDRISGRALTPVISWQDRRAQRQLASIAPRAHDIDRRTGLRLSPHYGASKMCWCLEHLDAVRAAADNGRLVLAPLASFLAFRLLAEQPLVVDPANAQRTLLWNIASGDWDDRLLELFEVPLTALPRCVPTHFEFGHLRIGPQRLPLTVLTGDQSAALFAFGEPATTTGYINIGTGAFVQRVLHTPQWVDGLLTSAVRRQAGATTYTLEGTVNGAGAALAWFSESAGLSDVEASLPDWLARTETPPIFLNGVGGLGAPYWQPNFASRFVGAAAPSAQAVAIAESIVFLLAVNIERLHVVGDALRTLLVTGGLARCDGLCQRLADLTGLPVQRPQEHEATARGLAGLVAGVAADWPASVGIPLLPIANAAFTARYAHWRAAMDDALRH